MAHALARFDATHEADSTTWDRDAANLGASVFHTHAWATYICRERGGQPIFARWLDTQGNVGAIAVGSLRSPVAHRIGKLTRIVSFDAPPAVADAHTFADIKPLISWARSTGALALSLGSFSGGGQGWNGGVRDPERRVEFVASPGEGPELLRRMRTMARRAVRRAERHGVEVERVGQVHAATFANLFESTVARLKREKQFHIGSFDSQRFASSLELLLNSDRGRLYLARLENESIAGCFFGCTETNAYYLYNGSTETALRVGATPLTLLRAMTDFSAEGFDHINLGGVPASAREPTSPDYGLYEFKLGLGSEPVECCGGRVPLRPMRLRLFDVASSVRAHSMR